MEHRYDEMLDVLKSAGIVRVEWRMFYNNDEGDLDSVVATFSDGSCGPLTDEVVDEAVPFSLWDLANHEVFDPSGARFNGLFVLDVNKRTVARTAEVFYDYDQQIDDTDRIFDERWHEYVGWDGTGEFPFWKLYWKRRILGEQFDEEALEREQEEKIDMENYFSVTPLENPQWYSL